MRWICTRTRSVLQAVINTKQVRRRAREVRNAFDRRIALNDRGCARLRSGASRGAAGFTHPLRAAKHQMVCGGARRAKGCSQQSQKTTLSFQKQPVTNARRAPDTKSPKTRGEPDNHSRERPARRHPFGQVENTERKRKKTRRTTSNDDQQQHLDEGHARRRRRAGRRPHAPGQARLRGLGSFGRVRPGHRRAPRRLQARARRGGLEGPNQRPEITRGKAAHSNLKIQKIERFL